MAKDEMVNREELAWAAGFFDGEGSFSCLNYSRPTYRYLSLHASIGQSINQGQNGNVILERFRRAVFGLGRIRGPYPTRKKPTWFYRAFGFESTQAIASALWPWLSEPKHIQFIETVKTYRNNHVHNEHSFYKPPARKHVI